jgi:peptide chain release factor 1
MTAVAFLNKFARIEERFAALEQELSGQTPLSPETLAKLSKERSDLLSVVEAIREFRRVLQEHEGICDLLHDPGSGADFREMAQAEAHSLKEQLAVLEHHLKVLLLPKDEADARSAIIEIRAGTGGDEAALFAASLLRLYERYAVLRGWKAELLSLNDTDLGGVREASLSLSGHDVFARLKFESGVHRVQRVPETEASGRVHTSTATVAVLP